MAVYYQGETVRIKASVTDTDGTLTDPSSIKITIHDADGTAKITDQDMTKDATGKYYYDYTIPGDGQAGLWRVQVTASSGKPAIEQDTFNVVEAI